MARDLQKNPLLDPMFKPRVSDFLEAMGVFHIGRGPESSEALVTVVRRLCALPRMERGEMGRPGGVFTARNDAISELGERFRKAAGYTRRAESTTTPSRVGIGGYQVRSDSSELI